MRCVFSLWLFDSRRLIFPIFQLYKVADKYRLLDNKLAILEAANVLDDGLVEALWRSIILGGIYRVRWSWV
jgi:hypothetical protein